MQIISNHTIQFYKNLSNTYMRKRKTHTKTLNKRFLSLTSKTKYIHFDYNFRKYAMDRFDQKHTLLIIICIDNTEVIVF